MPIEAEKSLVIGIDCALILTKITDFGSLSRARADDGKFRKHKRASKIWTTGEIIVLANNQSGVFANGMWRKQPQPYLRRKYRWYTRTALKREATYESVPERRNKYQSTLALLICCASQS
eukprot:737873-Pleurochrysis_carterae.AAC.3